MPTGELLRWNPSRGFGFLRPDDGTILLFLHIFCVIQDENIKIFITKHHTINTTGGDDVFAHASELKSGYDDKDLYDGDIVLSTF